VLQTYILHSRIGTNFKIIPYLYRRYWKYQLRDSINTTYNKNQVFISEKCLLKINMTITSRDSVVDIATAYRLDDQGVWVPSPSRVKNFLFSTLSRPVLGSTQPPIQWVPGALSPGVKWQGREADHSPPTSAEVKKMWIYISTPP
jgi:hypothetical protein